MLEQKIFQEALTKCLKCMLFTVVKGDTRKISWGILKLVATEMQGYLRKKCILIFVAL